MYPVKSVTNLMEVSQREMEVGGGGRKGWSMYLLSQSLTGLRRVRGK